jgi:hypothetical protein
MRSHAFGGEFLRDTGAGFLAGYSVNLSLQAPEEYAGEIIDAD